MRYVVGLLFVVLISFIFVEGVDTIQSIVSTPLGKSFITENVIVLSVITIFVIITFVIAPKLFEIYKIMKKQTN